MMDSGVEVDYTSLYNYNTAHAPIYAIPTERVNAMRERLNDYLNFDANYNLKHGLYERAVTDYLPRSNRYPTSSKILHHLGMAYYGKGELEKARRSFKQATEGDAGNKYGSSDWLDALDEKRVDLRPESAPNALPVEIERRLLGTWESRRLMTA